MNKISSTLFLGMLSAAISTSVQAASTYGVTDLGTGFTAYGLNDLGSVAGGTSAGAAIWSAGVVTPLPNGVMTGGSVFATAINNSGVILGQGTGVTASTPPGIAAQVGGVAVWSSAVATPTMLSSNSQGTGGGFSDTSSPIALNNAGQALYSVTSNTSNSTTLWSSSTQSSTTVSYCSATVSANCWGVAEGLNDQGQVVGNSAAAVLIWQGGVATTVTSGFTASSINNSGDIVGNTASGTAIFWDGKNQVSLGSGVAEDVNNAGMVVGHSSANAALLWTSDTSPAIALDALVDPNLGWHFTNALQINNLGQILAVGTLGSSTAIHTVLLQAVPESTTYVYLFVGLGIMFLGHQRRVALRLSTLNHKP